MLLVISPAKNLEEAAALPDLAYSQPEFLSGAQVLVNSLKPLGPHQVSKLMKLSDKLGALNYERFQRWTQPFTLANARPAALTFNGDVYQGMSATNFSEQDFVFAQQHLRILSGLYGLLRPLDLIQAYRLEMGTKLPTSRGKDLYAFWGDKITQALNSQLQILKSDALINLASSEYFKAVKPQKLTASVIEPVFKDYKNGQYKMISFYAKRARGLMAAYCIKHRLTDPESLKAFSCDGYAFNKALTSGNRWVFTRRE
jgi:cytoplasmic iron level regulating protein YaaA (DUF328/UPF0246 family)